LNLRHRRERIHDRHHIGGVELIRDEVLQRLPDRHVVAAANVVIVEQQHEQSYVGTGGLPLLVEVAANRRSRP
jgi:hypothetical protein